jgi:hypothetical protein
VIGDVATTLHADEICTHFVGVAAQVLIEVSRRPIREHMRMLKQQQSVVSAVPKY